MDEYTREPCPWRILDDSGGAFIMGAIGGGIFHSIKGFRNAPVGFSRKMVTYIYLFIIQCPNILSTHTRLYHNKE